MLGVRSHARNQGAARLVALGFAAATAVGAPFSAWAAAKPAHEVQASPNPLGLMVRARRHTILVDQYVSISARVNTAAINNSQDLQRDINLESRNQTTRKWKVVASYQVDQGQPDSLPSDSVALDRNTLFRLHALGTTNPVQPDTDSPTIIVYVLPRVTLSALRDGSGHVTYLYDAQVHALRHPRLEHVYLYRRRSSRERYVRIAALKLRYSRLDLTATKRVYDPRGAQILACVRHQLVPDMGLHFFDPTCGRRTLAVRSDLERVG